MCRNWLFQCIIENEVRGQPPQQEGTNRNRPMQLGGGQRRPQNANVINNPFASVGQQQNDTSASLGLF